MDIRHMEPRDADEVSRLYVKSWQAGYKGLLPQYYLDLLSPDRWKDKFAGLPGSFVLTEGGIIAGHSCARPAEDERMPGWGEVHTLYVLPEFWGKGFGTALLDNSVKWLEKQGFERIYLSGRWIQTPGHAGSTKNTASPQPLTRFCARSATLRSQIYAIYGILREAHNIIPNSKF